MKTTGKISWKPYRCRCGAEKELQTNHWGECYVKCAVCYLESNGERFQGRWTCLEQPPEGVGLPAPWTEVTLEEVVVNKKDH